MQVTKNHPWVITADQAMTIQYELRPYICQTDKIKVGQIQSIAGIDNSYYRSENSLYAVATVVVFTYPELNVIDIKVASCQVTFPYVPGLLAFREAPPVLMSLAKLEATPDILIFDGHGIAHPRMMGIATHIGILLDWPSIGCAKSRLTGSYSEPKQRFGAYSTLKDEESGAIIGVALRTRPPFNPIFVSPGHKISLDTAIAVTINTCSGKSRIPIPTQVAHKIATDYRNTLGNNN